MSPVSVGTLLSNRTLEVGASHLDSPLKLVTLEQFPVADDPFTDIVSAVRKKYLAGIPAIEIIMGASTRLVGARDKMLSLHDNGRL